MGFTPTEEQAHILELARTGESVAVQAGAGAGKTSTLRLLADDQPKKGLFLAYNKAIATDAKGKFPERVECRTGHSLAYGPVGSTYRGRLNAKRMSSAEIAKVLGVDALDVTVAGNRQRLLPARLAGMVVRGMENFYNSADAEPRAFHVPAAFRDVPGADTGDVAAANAEIRAHLAPHLTRMWADVRNPNGRLPMSHDAYLAMYVMSDPVLDVEVVYADELQDSTRRMVQFLRGQAARGVQVIGVGDTRQAIYKWRGSVEGFDLFGFTHEAHLTQSFRFGPEIAAAANLVLERLGEFRMEGLAPAGTVGTIDGDPDVTLCRTNAVAVSGALAALESGRKVAVVGGVADVIAFAKAVEELTAKGRTEHPEISWAASWDQVRTYAREDDLGSDLLRLVRLVDEWGPKVLIEKLAAVGSDPARADVCFSTAHKAKGLEWGRVRLAEDFRDAEKITGEEACLLYVAVTRAMRHLDVDAVDFYHPRVKATVAA